MKLLFEGSGVALITPFKEDLSINYDKLKELVDFHVENKTDAIIVAGTTGEASTLPDSEHIELIKKTVEFTAGRIPVIAGTGSNDTAHAVELSVEAEKVGADGLLVVTPYYNKSNDKGLEMHFKAVAEAVNIPILLYSVPSRTGVKMSVSVIEKLSKIDNIVGIKEASGDMSYTSEIARICGENFAIYSGNDDIIVPVLSVGGKGVISVLANVMPEETHQMIRSYLDGDSVSATRLQLKLNGLVNALFYETNPIPVKKALNLMGFNVGGYRMPLYEMDATKAESLKEEMIKVGIEVK